MRDFHEEEDEFRDSLLMIIVDEPTSPARMSSCYENEDSYSSLDIDEALDEVMKEPKGNESKLFPLQSESHTDSGYNEVVCRNFESPIKEIAFPITENGGTNDVKENGEGIDHAVEKVTMPEENLHSEREPSMEYTILTEKNYQPSEFEKRREKNTPIVQEEKCEVTSNIQDQMLCVQTDSLNEESVHQLSEELSSTNEYAAGNKTNEDKITEEITIRSYPGNIMTQQQVVGITENTAAIDSYIEGVTLEFSKPRPLVTDLSKEEAENDEMKADEARETNRIPKERKNSENKSEKLENVTENDSQITAGREDGDRVSSEDSSETEETTPSTENESLPRAEEEICNLQRPDEDVGRTENSEQMHSTLQQVLGGTSIRRDIEAETDSLMPREDGSEREGERESRREVGETEIRERGREMGETERTIKSGSESEMEIEKREKERTWERAPIRDNKEPESLLRSSCNSLVNASESLLTREGGAGREGRAGAEAGGSGGRGGGEGAATGGELALDKKSFRDLHISGDLSEPQRQPLLTVKAAKKVRFPDDGNLATHYTPEVADEEEEGEGTEEEKVAGKGRAGEEDDEEEQRKIEARGGLFIQGVHDILSEEDFIHFCFLASAISVLMYFITIWFT